MTAKTLNMPPFSANTHQTEGLTPGLHVTDGDQLDLMHRQLTERNIHASCTQTPRRIRSGLSGTHWIPRLPRPCKRGITNGKRIAVDTGQSLANGRFGPLLRKAQPRPSPTRRECELRMQAHPNQA